MSKMEIDIPKQLIEDTIRAELIRNISAETKEGIIESIVSQSLSEKASGYGRETIFQKAIKEMIQEEGRKVFREWIEANRSEISDAMFKYMNGNKQKTLKKFCESLAGNIMSYGIRVDMRLEDHND